MIRQVDQEEFHSKIECFYTNIIAKNLGGKVLKYSDQTFASAINLIGSREPNKGATRFTDTGAWYDGWETRRHNPNDSDWVIFKMGVPSAKLIGCEINTTFFDGNHAPYISVEAINLLNDSDLEDIKESEWESVIKKVKCNPSQKHFFVRDLITEKYYTHVRLRMYPDGGIARFKLYGHVITILPKYLYTILDTAYAKNGGVVIKYSDQHFSSVNNLLLPGRGYDMSDGWETKRSRRSDHFDWVIIRLGGLTKIREIIIDTAYYKANSPQTVNIKAIKVCNDFLIHPYNNENWDLLVNDLKIKPHKENFFELNDENLYSHVLVTITPDGGIKRIRVFGNMFPKKLL